MVVEVLSEYTRRYDLLEKRQLYQEAGIKEIWFVDDDNHQIIVDCKLNVSYGTETPSSDKICSTVLEGFWIDVSWLWQDEFPDPMKCLEKILQEAE